jgi:hypothetical protein
MQRFAEDQLVRKAVVRFLRAWAKLAGVEWSDQLEGEIIAAAGAAIRAHAARKAA